MANLEVITIADYIARPDKQELNKFLVKVVQHALDKNFDLYMTYDKSCEPRAGFISCNMLTNAIIDLTHKRSASHYASYEAKSSDFYRSYYGMDDDSGWKTELLHIKDNLSKLIDNVLKYNMEGHNAFPNDADFVAAIDKAAWNALFSQRNR